MSADMKEMVTGKCALCGATFQRDVRKMRKAQKFYCSKRCAAMDAVNNGKIPFAKQTFPVETRIRITAKIPVFEELRPKIGTIYDALKFESRYGGHGGYVIVSGGKRINVRLDEAVEV